MNDKPDIVEVIGARVDLRKSGREFRGLCPFHNDRNPSMRVNHEKQVWFDDPCGIGGDVFSFVMLSDGVTFPEALKILGIEGESKPRLALTEGRKAAAARAAAWANEQRQKIRVLLDNAYEQRDDADEAGAFEISEIFDREVVMLRGFCDALEYPRGAVEMLASKESIEQLTAGVEIIYDKPAPFPPLTPDYIATLANNPMDFSRCF